MTIFKHTKVTTNFFSSLCTLGSGLVGLCTRPAYLWAVASCTLTLSAFRVHIFHGWDLAPKCACAKVCAAAARRKNRRSCNVFRISPRSRQLDCAMPGGGWGSLLCMTMGPGLSACQARNGRQTITSCTVGVLSNSWRDRPWWCVGLSARLLQPHLCFEPVRLVLCLTNSFHSEWLLLGLEPFLITSWESSCRSRTTEPQLSEMHHKIRQVMYSRLIDVSVSQKWSPSRPCGRGCVDVQVRAAWCKHD